MKKRDIVVYTETPEIDLWKKLLQYSYKARIQAYFTKNGIKIEPDNNRIYDVVSGAFLQANEYFALSKSASLYTAPLLLYYGAANLILGAVVLMTGKELNVQNHGMKILLDDSSSMIGATKIHFLSPDNGGINVFLREFADGINLVDTGDWTLEELLLSIPEINLEASQCYVDSNYCLAIDTIFTENGMIERVCAGEENSTVFDDVPGFKKSYLNPQYKEIDGKGFFILKHKYLQDQICYSSYTGQTYLLRSHSKNGNDCLLPQWAYMYSALFASASLCRYYPQKWNPFIRLDDSGEKLLIDQFLETTRRILPNIILSKIEGQNYKFENKKYEAENRVKILGEHEIKDLIQAQIKERR